MSKLAMSKQLTAVVAGLLITVCSSSVWAVVIDATVRGAYTSAGSFGTGGSGTAGGNYLTGQYGINEYRSFFNFDLSGLTDTVTSAEFLLDTNSIFPVVTSDTSETLSFFEFTGDESALFGNTGGVTAFENLGAGTLLAQAVFSNGQHGPYSIVFGSLGLDVLNANLGGSVTIGGRITSLSGGNEFLFGGTLDGTLTSSGPDPSVYRTQLIISDPVTSVPEPSTLAIFGLGLLGLGLHRKHKAA